MTTPHSHDKANLPHYLDVMTRAEAEHHFTKELSEWFVYEWCSECSIENARLLSCRDATQTDLDTLLGSCVRWLGDRPNCGYCPRNTKGGWRVVYAQSGAYLTAEHPTPLAACIAAMENILNAN